MNAPLLSVKNLKVGFEQGKEIKSSINGISFEIKENEIVGLVGESGSGKTLTALSIMKLLPTKGCRASGEIIFSPGEGKRVDLLDLGETENRDIRGSKIAMVFQEPFTSKNPVLRVGEQVDEVILIHRKCQKKEAKNRTLALLEKVKIADPGRIYGSYP